MSQKNSKGKNKSNDSSYPKKGRKNNWFKEIIAIFSWVTVLMLWLSAGSAYINPSNFRFLSILGLVFPFLVAGVIAALIICLLFNRRQCWIPILGLLVCTFSIRTYCPINIPESHPKDCYKIISYNTLGFATSLKDSAKEEGLLEYVTQSGADFFCFQEGLCVPAKLLGEKILPRLDKVMHYHDTVSIAENILGCSSKYPILKKEILCKNGMNGAAVFYIQLKKNDTLRLINCHLQSMGLSQDDRTQYHELVKHLNDSNAEKHSRLLISKISKASVARSVQVDSIASYIERNKGKNMIVCGDFNDTPISYAHQRIHSTGLTDAYSKTANGIGRSFNRDAIYVRIDHLFCSKHWEPYGCHIDNTIGSSDHYPIVGYLKLIKD